MWLKTKRRGNVDLDQRDVVYQPFCLLHHAYRFGEPTRLPWCRRFARFGIIAEAQTSMNLLVRVSSPQPNVKCVKSVYPHVWTCTGATGMLAPNVAIFCVY